MKFFQRLTLLCMMLCVSTAAPQANAQERVETLLQQMTLEEKVGQLNMLGIQDTPTGPVIDQGTLSHLPEGTVGSILGAYGFEQTARCSSTSSPNRACRYRCYLHSM
ncbi:hypothetical protein [Pseudomonas cyclaminis]|uniref:hypothetical protein n=1 Tax=Pseudomonas cyclaminis TaxID=2781239 RepID=UPI0020949833|nr:hypothetical protein [Pseudomonas cyclaminis]